MFRQLCVVILLNIKWRELYIEPSFDDERRFAKIIAGWLEELAYNQKEFQPMIPDS